MTKKQKFIDLDFITIEEAAEMTSGTRVTFVPGMQAIYAEALKNVCFVKKIPIIRVLHPKMGIDKKTGKDRQAKLYELTSQTSLPTMFHDEERPRNVWIEQLSLAEKIGSNDSPSLIPRDFKFSPPTLKYSISEFSFFSSLITFEANLSPDGSPVRINIFFI